MVDCRCYQPPFDFRDYHQKELGNDSAGAEVTLDCCRSCGQHWLKRLIEEAHHSRSGRWWRLPVNTEQANSLTANGARSVIENADWCFIGGSGVSGSIRKVERPILVL